MITEKIFLTPKEIYEHEFKIDARGYRPQEVDKFLDVVIRDYSEFITIIKRLEVENNNLQSDNYKLKDEVRKLRESLDIVGSASNGKNTNVDMLKRLSELEKIVYGNDNN